jgi:hypothetical protein
MGAKPCKQDIEMLKHPTNITKLQSSINRIFRYVYRCYKKTRYNEPLLTEIELVLIRYFSKLPNNYVQFQLQGDRLAILFHLLYKLNHDIVLASYRNQPVYYNIYEERFVPIEYKSKFSFFQ